MSAVILAVIVVMWAVVLVPMWLRRHDANTESRSVDRFSTAMRVLSRRNSASPDRRYVVMPKREVAAEVHVSGAGVSRRPARRPATAAPPARPKSRPSIAVRRKRVLVGLLGLTFLTFVLMIAGVVAWPFQFVVDLALVAFVVHLRNQAKRTTVVARQRRRAAAVPAAQPAARMPCDASAAPAASWSPPLPAAEPVATHVAATTRPAYVEEPALPVVARATGTDDAIAESALADGVADDRSAWDPIPVPPPTYTMKPKAPPRRSWSPPSAQPAAAQAGATQPDKAQPEAAEVEERTAANERRAATGEPDELDGILEHRWAVND